MRRFWYSVVLVLGFATLLGASSAGAQSVDQAIRVNGFVSQGYLNTDTVDYLIPNSTDGSALFTEAAATITATPMERLRIAAQFLARTFGGTSGVTLDWGYGDYRWRDALGVRAGKVKLPHGLYNEVRDLDFLRTSVFLPQSVYNEDYRDFLQAYAGVGAYGNFDVGGIGEFDYHVYGGTLNGPDATSGYWYDSYRALAETIEPGVEEVAEELYPPGTAEAELVDLLDPRVTFPYIYGGALTWNTPLESLRIGSTLIGGSFNYTATFRYDIQMTNPGDPPRYYPVNLDFEDDSDIDHIMVLSGEYAHEDLLLVAEYGDSRINDITTEGWYVQADYRLVEPLSVAAIYSVFYDDKNNRDGSNYEEFGLPAYYAWQKDWTVAASYSITDFWLIKAEYHFMNGVALDQRESLEEDLANPKPQYWHMFAAKTTFNF